MKQTDHPDPDELRPEYTPSDFEGAVRGKYAGTLPARTMSFAINCEQQGNGLWRADVVSFPDATAYGASQEDVVDAAEAIVSEAIANQVERGEIPPTTLIFVIEECAAPPQSASS